MTKRGSQDNQTTNEFFCDTIEDRDAIPVSEINLGSVAVVLKPALQVFIAGSDRQWNSMAGAGGEG